LIPKIIETGSHLQFRAISIMGSDRVKSLHPLHPRLYAITAYAAPQRCHSGIFLISLEP